MKTAAIRPYLANAFWLLLPILAFNALFLRFLPGGYQAGVFWREIPAWIGTPEKLLRLPVFILPLVMRPRLSTPARKLGLGLYVAGTLVYFLAWGAQIMYPLSAWSTGMAGFMAPAFTPALFLAGIGLMGDTWTLPNVPCNPWIYRGLSALFLLFHNLHAALVFIRKG